MLIGDVQKKKFPNDTRQSGLKLGLSSRVGSLGCDLMTLRSESCSESQVFSVLPGSSEPGVVLASRAPARLRPGSRGTNISRNEAKGMGSSGLPSLDLVLGYFGANS